MWLISSRAGFKGTASRSTSSDGYIPYSAIPARTRLCRYSGKSMIPALLSQLRQEIRSFRRSKASCIHTNRSCCSRVNAGSVSSAFAKWVNIPSGTTPGSLPISAMVSALSSDTGNPILPMPVSILMWKYAVLQSFTAARDISSAISFV